MLSDIEALKVKSKSSVPLSESDDSKILSLEKDLKQGAHKTVPYQNLLLDFRNIVLAF